ncbi:MAG: phage portal protein [Faecousia sp.]
MSFMDKVREKARSFLRIEEAGAKQISIRETLDFQGNAIKNRIWYRGDSTELAQLYQHIAEGEDRRMFWAAQQTPGMEIRKIHTGLPATIVNTLAGIVVTNLNDFAFADKAQEELWEKIAEENDVKALIQRAVTETLYIGDGAFKVSLDSEISAYPILEFFPGDRVEYTYRRGRLTEIIFRSELRTETGRRCELREIYGMNYVRYKVTMNGQPVDMTAVPGLAGLQDVTFGTEDKRYMMAVPVCFSRSDRWEGRGQSIFDTKIDAFDAYDEAWSQWMDALRAGRAKTYIPDNLIPRDPKTGTLKHPNAFDDRFIRTESNMTQGVESKITTEQPQIPHDSYAATYATALDMCLQGLISPSTLGIDVKKLDNAEAQREKEKVTLYTRDRLVETLQADLKQLVEVAILAYHEAEGKTMTDEISVDVTFGDYANPSFESQVETLSKARTGGLMSTEAAVDELYGDTQSEEWKAEEVKRIKQESGVELMPEPAVNLDRMNGYGV